MWKKLIVPALLLGAAAALAPVPAFADSDDYGYRPDYYADGRARHAREEWREHQREEWREQQREEFRENRWRAHERHEWLERHEANRYRRFHRGYYDRFGYWHAY